MTYVMNF